ncbi:MAG TPA: NAD(P)H-dependent oxidoreductase [Gemmatimonadaceae bacterium]|jgi:NAD(P)H-dependent FMN reductase
MLNLQVIIASTREGRHGNLVGGWFFGCAKKHGKFNVELVDLADVNLPLMDEPKHPRFQDYHHEHTKRWSAIVSRADTFVFVTPEYDFSSPASLVNALQFLFREWAYKPVGFASYGGVSGGMRGVQMTKQLVTSLKMMPMQEAVAIPMFAQFIDNERGAFDPGEVQEKAANVMLDELLRWTEAMKPLRV